VHWPKNRIEQGLVGATTQETRPENTGEGRTDGMGRTTSTLVHSGVATTAQQVGQADGQEAG